MRYFTLLLLTICFLGCDLENLDDPIIVENIEDEMYLDLFEELATPNRGLLFLVETIDQEDCLNATINTSLNRQPARMALNILEVEPPGECDPGLAPALGSEQAGIVASTNYVMTVNVRNAVESEGLLEVTEDVIYLNFAEENGFRLRTPELRRISSDLVWGHVIVPASGSLAEATEVAEAIGQMGTEPHDLVAGYYGYFQVTGSNAIAIQRERPSQQHVAFAYRYTGNATELATALANVRATYPDYPVYLINGRGETF